MESKNGGQEAPQKTALVTGGSKGIGFAIAKRFLSEGFRVVICARSEESLAQAFEQEQCLDGRVCDVSSSDAVAGLAAELSLVYGALDVLVNNAGVYEPGQLMTEPDGALERMLDANVKGAYFMARSFAPAMADRKRGSIFNICSTASIVAYENGGSYCIAKHALLGFSKVLREEMKPHGVRVTSVIPGATLTASWDGVDLPPERLMRPEDVADAVWAAYALSDRAVVEEIVMRPQLGDIA